MIYLFYGVHVLICLFLILVVLLQQGKGADLSVFGGGGTMTAFGARGATTLLHKLTVFGFIGFIVTTLGIGILQSYSSSSSVMSVVDELEEEAVGGEAAAAEDAQGVGDPLEGLFTETEEPGDATNPGSGEPPADGLGEDGAAAGTDDTGGGGGNNPATGGS